MRIGGDPVDRIVDKENKNLTKQTMTKKNLVIYHRADFDGLFCREIAKKFLGDTADYIGWDYGDAKIDCPTDQTVYVLDLSPECFVTSTIIFSNLIWIDHHKSAIEKFPESIRGYRIDGVAACRLAWQWFAAYRDYPETHSLVLPLKFDFVDRKVQEPFAVQLAGEYDIWDKRNPDAEVFQFGLRSENLDNNWWQLLTTNQKVPIEEIEAMADAGHPCILHPEGTATQPVVLRLLKNGRMLQTYQQQSDAQVVRERSFLVEFEGLTFLALNTARCNSLTFAALDTTENSHAALMAFYTNGHVWSVSLYHAKHRTDLDLSKIAVKYGGGGHRGACGFRAGDLPFIRSELRDMQMAAISTATLQNTPGTRLARIDRNNPYWTPAYADVCLAIDREIILIQQTSRPDWELPDDLKALKTQREEMIKTR